jgi:glycerol uptake facilitator-like aquaporin
MEIKPKHLGFALLHEFIGCVIFGAALNIARQRFQMGLGFDNTLMFGLLFIVWLVYSFSYNVSGGHLNPAITIANVLRMDGSFNVVWGIAYIFAQVFGFGGGIFIGWWYWRQAGSLKVYREPITNEYWLLESFFMELFATLFFTLTFLLQTNPKTSTSNHGLWHTMLIAFTWVATFIWSQRRTGPEFGGSNNPAYGFAQMMLDLWDDGHSVAFQHAWIYIAAPLVGSVIAWALYQFVYVKAHEMPIHTETNKI